jgi:hypothetical protein
LPAIVLMIQPCSLSDAVVLFGDDRLPALSTAAQRVERRT